MKTQVYIVTGFLGAGKTTLLKRILRFSEDLSSTVVLVNEFGKVGIDSALIKRTAAADIVELSQGCICCSLRTDMIQSLQILRHEYAPSRLIIEATGVADPAGIVEALADRMLAPHFGLSKTITVVDSDFWEAKEAFGSVFESQIETADVILLNKIDTVEPRQVEDILQEIQVKSAHARVIPTLHCNVDPDIFWSETVLSRPAAPENALFQPYDPKKDISSRVLGEETPASAEAAGFITFSFETPALLDQALFDAFLKNLPLKLFRIKGPVRFASGTRMLNFAGGKFSWEAWPETSTTCLAFIGWDVIEGEVLEKVNQCMNKTAAN